MRTRTSMRLLVNSTSTFQSPESSHAITNAFMVKGRSQSAEVGDGQLGQWRNVVMSRRLVRPSAPS